MPPQPGHARGFPPGRAAVDGRRCGGDFIGGAGRLERGAGSIDGTGRPDSSASHAAAIHAARDTLPRSRSIRSSSPSSSRSPIGF